MRWAFCSLAFVRKFEAPNCYANSPNKKAEGIGHTRASGRTGSQWHAAKLPTNLNTSKLSNLLGLARTWYPRGPRDMRRPGQSVELRKKLKHIKAVELARIGMDLTPYQAANRFQ